MKDKAWNNVHCGTQVVGCTVHLVLIVLVAVMTLHDCGCGKSPRPSPGAGFAIFVIQTIRERHRYRTAQHVLVIADAIGKTDLVTDIGVERNSIIDLVRSIEEAAVILERGAEHDPFLIEMAKAQVVGCFFGTTSYIEIESHVYKCSEKLHPGSWSL